jgi:hypothetical protein
MSFNQFNIEKANQNQVELSFSDEPTESTMISYSSKHDHFALEWVNAIHKNSKLMNFPSMKHMVYSTVNQTQDPQVAFKAITKYLIPTFETSQDQFTAKGVQVPAAEWDNQAWENGKLKVGGHLFITINSVKMYFSGFALAIGRLTYHQRMSLITQCPGFCINNCVINVNGIWKKIGSWNNLVKCAILFHLIERNKGLREKAIDPRQKAMMMQMGLKQKRNFKMDSMTIICNQFAINWSFLAKTESVNSPIAPSVGEMKSKVAIVNSDGAVKGTVYSMIDLGDQCGIQFKEIDLFSECSKPELEFEVGETWQWFRNAKMDTVSVADMVNEVKAFNIQKRTGAIVNA